MTNTPRDTLGPSGGGCRNVQERVLQPNGQFRTRSVERCNESFVIRMGRDWQEGSNSPPKR